MPGDQSRVVEFRLGDTLRLRRAHPCGGQEWLVDRLGADIGLRCRTCGRHVLIERRTLERRLIGFTLGGDVAMLPGATSAAGTQAGKRAGDTR